MICGTSHLSEKKQCNLLLDPELSCVSVRNNLLQVIKLSLLCHMHKCTQLLGSLCIDSAAV